MSSFKTAIFDGDQNLCLYVRGDQDISACLKGDIEKKFTTLFINKCENDIVRICNVANAFVAVDFDREEDERMREIASLFYISRVGYAREVDTCYACYEKDFSNKAKFKRETDFQIKDLNDGTFRIYHPATEKYLFITETKAVYARSITARGFDKRSRFSFSNLEYRVSICFERIIKLAQGSEKKPLKDFLVEFPMGGDLHCHTTGAIDPFCLLQFAKKANMRCKKDAMIFCKEEDVPQNEWMELITVKDILDNKDLENSFYEKTTIKKQRPSSDVFFAAFNSIQSITRYMPLYDLFMHIVMTAYKQNIQYIETSKGFELEFKLEDREEYYDQFPEEISNELLDRKLELIRDLLEEKQNQYISKLNEADEDKWIPKDLKEKDFKSLFSRKNPTVIRLNVDLDRLQDNPYFFADLALAFQLVDYEYQTRQKDPRIVGIVISGRESHPGSQWNIDSQNKMIDYFKAKYSYIPISPHAGELCEEDVNGAGMMKPMKNALKHGAKRIGHGVTVDDEGPKITDLIKKNNTCIEVCLTSNEIILGINPKDHPIKTFFKHEIDFTINTDDPGVLNTTLFKEFWKLILEYTDGKITYLMLKKLSRNAIRHSFLQKEEIFKDNSYELLDCFACEPLGKEAEAILENSPKASMQYKLEKAFEKFEKWVVDEGIKLWFG